MGRRFSDYFQLGKAQSELDFVDIPLNTDIPLFVDPYAISIIDDPWFHHLNDLIVGYFQLVVDSIRRRDRQMAARLLLNLHEPNDTHLGLSRGRPSGRGIGAHQARDLYDALRNSNAVRSGSLRDLEEMELLIPGIGNDKISDIAINIVRGELLEYTRQQCEAHGVPMRDAPSGKTWDPSLGNWVNRYTPRPVFRLRPLLLVPKAAVRFQLTMNHQKYYNKFVLEYLQAEHLKANSGLVEVLKNGRRRVTKKSLKNQPEYRLTKEFLYEFSEEHPQVLEDYKASLPKTASYPSDPEIEARQTDPRTIDHLSLLGRLKEISPGHKDANKYHSFILGALESIFYPALRRPQKEAEINQGRKRIDILFDNGNTGGVFSDLRQQHGFMCPYIPFECKNYSGDPKNNEFDQLIGRFSRHRGNVGIMVCRSIDNRERMIERCRDVVREGQGLILVLADDDIKELVRLRASNDETGIHDLMRDRLREILM